MGGPQVFANLDELASAVGTELGTSSWHEITQQRINQFADATGDHQWIHVDVERAANGPFGATVAHGYLSLSLLPMLTAEIFEVQGVEMGINYGADRIRFPAPVKVGSRVRAKVSLAEMSTSAAGTMVRTLVVLEQDSGEKPVCVAELLGLYR